MTSAQLTWPGVDKQRALGACFHLERACTFISRAIVYRARTGKEPVRALGTAATHSRIARGYLGAIGFEKGGRL